VCAEVESALKTRLRGDAKDDASSMKIKGGSEGSNVTGSKRPRVVVVGHSLGGALAALCAARLAHDPEVVVLDDAGIAEIGAGVVQNLAAAASSEESSPTAVSCVTFGQPRVGDGGFRRGVDAAHAAGRLTYQRVVRGGDLFARVPTSGVWLPGGNEDRFGVAYEHAGSMVWAEADAAIGAGVGEPAPPGFNSDWRMINPARVASDHAGYAYFFEDDALKKAWPRTHL
jgi:pimeloyl-ACP methyl ester carboxylesterase